MKGMWIAGILVMLSWSAVTAVENPKNAEKVLSGGSFGDVPFAHKTHQAALDGCNVCHDLFPKASGAVDRLKQEGRLYGRQVMNQCTSCHLREKRKGRRSGSTSCGGCHRE